MFKWIGELFKRRSNDLLIKSAEGKAKKKRENAKFYAANKEYWTTYRKTDKYKKSQKARKKRNPNYGREYYHKVTKHK